MAHYSKRIDVLVTQLSMLPGIGEKTAERLAFHIVKLPKERTNALVNAITDASEHAKICKVCCATSDEDLCPVCKSTHRDHKTIMVVENDEDMAKIERAGFYNGVYHVLQGTINPIEGRGTESVRLKELMARLAGDVEEVVIATGLSVEGETTASYIIRLVKSVGVKVTRLASGLPIGSDVSSADEATIKRAVIGRSEA